MVTILKNRNHPKLTYYRIQLEISAKKSNLKKNTSILKYQILRDYKYKNLVSLLN